MLSVPGAAAAFMDYFLPKNISSILDLETLQAVPAEFLDPKMAALFADLIFECRLKNQQKEKDLSAYFITEHKSNPSAGIITQLGRYQMELYQRQADSEKHPLRPIISIVYSHAEENWKPGDIEDLLDDGFGPLKSYTPSFRLIFHDVKNIPDQEIRKIPHSLLRLGILMQKYFRNIPALDSVAEELFHTLFEIKEKVNFKEHYLRYISALYKNENERLMDIIKELPADAKESSMHLIELIEYRGEKRGERRGEKREQKKREEYKKSVVRNMLLKNADIDFICEVAEVSKEYVLEIQKNIQREKES